MNRGEILHETHQRIRFRLAPDVAPDAARAAVVRVPGVRSARANRTLGCIAVGHDGEPATREAVLSCLREPAIAASGPTSAHRSSERGTDRPGWLPAALGVAVLALPGHWQRGGALATVAARVLTQSRRLRDDPAAVLLDAASLGSLAVAGQPQVVSASVLLRLLIEQLTAGMVRDADDLLGRLLPAEAERYRVLRDPADRSDDAWRPLRDVRAGDRLRLLPGDLVPVDGCVVGGDARLAPSPHYDAVRRVGQGDHVLAGERLQDGSVELHALADAASSRLARLRAQLSHAIGSRDPAGLAPKAERLLSLPLTAAALVLGLTGDTARAAAMLQADPQQGLDLALPLAREAALVALARRGLLAGGLEVVERLATARVLVLQDAGVLADGRWTIDEVHGCAAVDIPSVRERFADLAGLPPEAGPDASFSDRMVRDWVRHGALHRRDQAEWHLAAPARLRAVWGCVDDGAIPQALPASGRLTRWLAVVEAGRVMAWVRLGSAFRPGADERLGQLAALGFEQLAIFVEGATVEPAADPAAPWLGVPGVEVVGELPGQRAGWLADATRDGLPLVLVHTLLRDLVPPGSLGLTPTDADAGAHGVLLEDPLASLVAARRMARAVHRRLQWQQTSAVGVNAALMTTAALRWAKPMTTALLHHGFALLLVLSSAAIGGTVSARPSGRGGLNTGDSS